MSTWTYIQIGGIPFLALSLTLYFSTVGFKAIKNISRFRFLVSLVMCVLAVDAFNWYTVAKPMSMPASVLWISNIVYFLLSEVIAYLWFLYVFHQVCGDRDTPRRRLWLRLSLVPLIAVCAVILTSPWNQLIFSIDPADHVYTRGRLHILQTACGFSYMLLASVIAWLRGRKAAMTEERNECYFLCRIVILPFVGGTLQIINFNFVFLWPFTAAAAFLIFIDYQSHWISVDPLTSLNNRGDLERYLHSRARDHRLGGYLMMMDIDRFKSINDRFGHLEGDRALRLVAQVLRNVFGVSGAFISRYGGDEFVVITDTAEPEAAIARCGEELRRKAREQALPYAISLSIGYAACGRADENSLASLMRQADSMMYERKKLSGAG